MLAIVRLQLVQDGVGTLHDALGHTCQLGHVDTERVLATSPFKLAKEDDFAIHFLHRYVVILDAFERLLHLVQ